MLCPCSQAAFLLPWKRVFNMSDSSLYVARRENAKALFGGFIHSRGGTLQVLTPPMPPLHAFLLTGRIELDVLCRPLPTAVSGGLCGPQIALDI